MSNDIPVKPDDEFVITSNIKMNEYAVQSHVVLEGFNTTKNDWVQVKQCPSGIDGPFEWHRYVCHFSPEPSISKLRLILNAGVTSEAGKEAITYFGLTQIDMINSDQVYETDFNNLISPNYLDYINSNFNNTNGINSFAKTRESIEIANKEEEDMKYNFIKINPTLWKLTIGNYSQGQIDPWTLAFAEAFDPLWQAQIYQNGSLLQTSNSRPLYGAINGFEINLNNMSNVHDGNLEIVIRYLPQDLFETGMTISLLSFFILIAFLLIMTLTRRNKKLKPKD